MLQSSVTRLKAATATRRVQVTTIVAAAISLGAGLFVGQALPGGPAPGPAMGRYDVNFTYQEETVLQEAGSIDFFGDAQFPLVLEGTNMSGLIVRFLWTDQSTSPTFDPGVSVNIDPPPYETPVGPGYTGITWSMVPGAPHEIFIEINGYPENRTVPAPSPQEAIAVVAGARINETAGQGEWQFSISVGGVPAGRLRPSGSISYELEVTIRSIVVESTLAK